MHVEVENKHVRTTDLTEETCRCSIWQLNGLPCIHVARVLFCFASPSYLKHKRAFLIQSHHRSLRPKRPSITAEISTSAQAQGPRLSNNLSSVSQQFGDHYRAQLFIVFPSSIWEESVQLRELDLSSTRTSNPTNNLWWPAASIKLLVIGPPSFGTTIFYKWCNMAQKQSDLPKDEFVQLEGTSNLPKDEFAQLEGTS